jgi:NADH-quinone oxidoreductase subunit M
MDLPWLTGIAVLPLIGAVVVRALPAALSRVAALIASLLPLAALVVMITRFETGRAGAYQFTESYSWIPAFGTPWGSTASA